MTTLSSMIILVAAQAAAVQAPEAASVDAKVATVETTAKQKEVDPVVCERVEEVGSLIRAKKVCMRKSQWEEQRRSDRSLIERSQVQRPMNGN